MNSCKRTPEQIIGKDALVQLIFEGYAVVPAEPTEAMCRAGESSKGGSSSETWVDGSYTPENVELIWKDMVAAARPAPIAQKEEAQ